MKKAKTALLIGMVAAFASGFGANHAITTYNQQKKATRQQSPEMVTLQIYNEESKTWDTYQGTLKECELYGDWKYEIMGKELVLTGARLIGQVPEGGTGE